MDKISSILPQNARVTSVDLEEAPPARPGSPSFGRKVGRNTVADRVSLSRQAKELAAQDTMMMKNPKETARAKSVDEINKKFFETRLKPVESEAPQSEQVLEKSFEAPEMAPLKEEIVSQYEPRASSSSRLSIEA
jgi:hypothetical protein